MQKTKNADRGTASRDDGRSVEQRRPDETRFSGDGLSDNTVHDVAQVFKLLSDETRLRVLLFLSQEDELHVRALCDLLEQSQPAVSHHLALLRVAGLIEARRDGKHNYYRLVPERFGRLLDSVFTSSSARGRTIRIENYLLTRRGDGEDR